MFSPDNPFVNAGRGNNDMAAARQWEIRNGRVADPLAPPPSAPAPSVPSFDFSGFEFPSLELPSFESTGPSIEEINRTNNRRVIDELWSSRFDFANQSISEVDRRIADEQARADLLGVDYEVTDEQRQQRVDNLFGTLWTEQDESRLANLTSQFGNPEQEDSVRSQIESGEIEYEFAFDINRGEGVGSSPSRTTTQPASSGRDGLPDINQRFGGLGEGQTFLTNPIFDENETALTSPVLGGLV